MGLHDMTTRPMAKRGRSQHAHCSRVTAGDQSFEGAVFRASATFSRLAAEAHSDERQTLQGGPQAHLLVPNKGSESFHSERQLLLLFSTCMSSIGKSSWVLETTCEWFCARGDPCSPGLSKRADEQEAPRGGGYPFWNRPATWGQRVTSLGWIVWSVLRGGAVRRTEPSLSRYC